MTAAILFQRPAFAPAAAIPKGATTPLVRLLGLDRLSAGRAPLVCRWHQDADGRLSCSWEPDPPAGSRL